MLLLPTAITNGKQPGEAQSASPIFCTSNRGYVEFPRDFSIRMCNFLFKGRNGSEETMEWNAFNGWTGKYVMKLAGIFNCVKEAEVPGAIFGCLCY